MRAWRADTGAMLVVHWPGPALGSLSGRCRFSSQHVGAGELNDVTPLISRQQLLIADQRTALLESEEADISIRLIEALGGGFGAASNANSVSR
jgi:hypothetical protein